MHLAIYAGRWEARAVVHAHPPTATGFAAARTAIDEPILPEVIATLGAVPLAPYATPGTPGLGEVLRPLLPMHDAFLSANHGVVTLGPDLEEAYFRLERVEHAAQILLVARLLGGASRLAPSDVLGLRALTPVAGESEPNPERGATSTYRHTVDQPDRPRKE